MPLKTGHTVVPVEGRLKELTQLFKLRGKVALLKPDNWTVCESYSKYGDKYYDFEWREDDVIVNTFCKAGTTWMQEIVWTLRHNVNFDNPDAKIPLAARSPIMDADFVVEHMDKPQSLVNAIKARCPDYDQSQGVFIKAAEIAPAPRTIKCHLGLPLLNPNALNKAKVVYVIRDPRDLCMSYYHHCRIWAYEGFEGTFEEFVEAYLGEGTSWGPYWPHVKSAWEKRDHPNMCIMFFDKLKRNPKPEYRKLADFLGVKVTDEQLDKIIHYTSFGEMKKRDDHIVTADDTGSLMIADVTATDGGFFRKGVSGGWKGDMTEEIKKKFDEWEAKNCPDPEILKQIRGE